MTYNVIDLIDKTTSIAIKEKTIYENIEKGNSDIPSMKIISKVLIQQVNKDIEYDENLKKHLANLTLDEIDFGVYDKMSFLINEFNKKTYAINVINTKEYLKLFLNFQKDVYSLLIDLQGRFVRTNQDMYTKTYETLSDLINNKAKQIAILEKILN